MEFSWQLLAKFHKNAFDAAAGSSDALWLPTELAGGGILRSGEWKRGQDSHTAVFSLCPKQITQARLYCPGLGASWS